MKKVSTILTFVFIQLLTQGQDSIPVFKNQIKISPFKIVDPINPGLKLSYERLYLKRLASQISITYLSDFPNIIRPFSNYKGFKIEYEEKYYFKSARHVKQYCSIELMYSKIYFDSQSYFSSGPVWNDSIMYEDNYSVEKQIIAINARYGLSVIIKHFIVDLSIGIGLKSLNVKQEGRINNNDIMAEPRHPNFYYEAEKPGKYYRVNLPFNIGIGYLF